MLGSGSAAEVNPPEASQRQMLTDAECEDFVFLRVGKKEE